MTRWINNNTFYTSRELESHYTERLKMVERSQREENQQLQERALRRVKEFEEALEKLRAEDEKLRTDLRYTKEEAADVTERLSQANVELDKKDQLIEGLQKNLQLLHSIKDNGEDISHQLLRVKELQQELSEHTTLVQELKESNRELQDQMDELTAEKEDLKQKYLAQKRKLQRKRSFGSKQQSTPRRRRRHFSSKEEKSPRDRPTSVDKAKPHSPSKDSPSDTQGAHESAHEHETNRTLDSETELPGSPSTATDQESVDFQEVRMQYDEEPMPMVTVWSSSDHEQSSDDLFARSSKYIP